MNEIILNEFNKISQKEKYWFKQYVRECEKATTKIINNNCEDSKSYEKYLKSCLRAGRKAQNKFQKYQKMRVLLEICKQNT